MKCSLACSSSSTVAHTALSLSLMSGAFAEGLALGKAADLPLEQLLQVLDLGAMSNPMFRGKGPLMAKASFDPNFPLKHAQKDMK